MTCWWLTLTQSRGGPVGCVVAAAEFDSALARAKARGLLDGVVGATGLLVSEVPERLRDRPLSFDELREVDVLLCAGGTNGVGVPFTYRRWP